MSIFSNLGYSSSSSSSSDFDNIVIESSYDMELGGAYDSIMESYDADLAVVEAMHAFDMAELEAMKESGSTTEYEFTATMEASLKDIWTKILAFFDKMVKTVMGYLTTAADFFNSMFMSGSEFVKKYEKRVNDMDLTGFEFETFDYSYTKNDFEEGFKRIKATDDEIKKTVDGIKGRSITKDNQDDIIRKLSEDISAAKYAAEEKLDTLRAGVAGASGKIGADAYRKHLHDKFRGNGKKKTHHDAKEAIKNLHGLQDISNEIKKAREEVKKTFKDLHSSIKQCAAEAERATGPNGAFAKAATAKASAIRANLQYSRAVKTIMTIYINEWSSAVNEGTKAYKSLCFRALQWKVNK